MKYIITAVLAFIVGLLLWLIKRERLSLQYELVESEPFPREQGIGKYFVIRLSNSGNKPVENTELEVTFPSGVIESASFSDQRLITNVNEEKSRFTGSLPLLNPGEVFGLTITTIGDPEMPSPKIVARAIGVTASPKQYDRIPEYLLPMLVGILGIVLATASITWFKQAKITKSFSSLEKAGELSELAKLEKRHKELEEIRRKEELGKPMREQLIFAILNRAGLGHLVPQLINTGGEITFWKTGLFLMHKFLLDQDSGDKYIAAMDSITDIPNICPSSVGFILYLVGKMEQFRGNSEKAIKYFEKCKQKTPLMYEHLMAQDPAYDLQSLRRYLLKNSKSKE